MTSEELFLSLTNNNTNPKKDDTFGRCIWLRTLLHYGAEVAAQETHGSVRDYEYRAEEVADALEMELMADMNRITVVNGEKRYQTLW